MREESNVEPIPIPERLSKQLEKAFYRALVEYGEGLGRGPDPATEVPLPDAVIGAVGITEKYAREDHVHPARITAFRDMTFYVSDNGDDTNDGLTAETPVKTLRTVQNIASGYDFDGYKVTISIIDSTTVRAATISGTSFLNADTITITKEGDAALVTGSRPHFRLQGFTSSLRFKNLIFETMDVMLNSCAAVTLEDITLRDATVRAFDTSVNVRGHLDCIVEGKGSNIPFLLTATRSKIQLLKPLTLSVDIADDIDVPDLFLMNTCSTFSCPAIDFGSVKIATRGTRFLSLSDNSIAHLENEWFEANYDKFSGYYVEDGSSAILMRDDGKVRIVGMYDEKMCLYEAMFYSDVDWTGAKQNEQFTFTITFPEIHADRIVDVSGFYVSGVTSNVAPIESYLPDNGLGNVMYSSFIARFFDMSFQTMNMFNGYVGINYIIKYAR